jgi:hypothetical protein
MHAATQNTPSRQTLIRALIIGALSTGLVACGGGGPGGADLIAGGSSGGGATTTPTPSPGATVTPTPVPIPATGRVTLTPTQATLKLGDEVQVTALVVDANNKPVSGAVVNFTTDNSLGLIRPAAALSGADGKVTTTLSVASISASGNVGQLAVTAKYKDVDGAEKSISNSMNYQIGASTLQIDSISAGTSSISANANTSIEVVASVNGKPISGEVVKFSSQCAQSGKATIDATAVTNSTGKAIASFTDKGCATTDTVTATLSNGQSKNTTVTIAAPTATSLQFASLSPADGLITLKGYGTAARPETAQVQFKLVDATGAAIPGQPVTFSLDLSVGGVALQNAVGGVVTATTDSSGIATAIVVAGNQPTPVRVTAKSGALISQSGKLAISSGFPDQDSVSLSANRYNINGFSTDGATATITMNFADHFNNPVPDGTTINFITDSGRIGTGTQGSCSTKDSSCVITLSSQQPRKNNGRVHIVAYAIGEESFVDKNNSIVADQVSELVDLNGASSDIGEAFMDVNENGVFDLGIDQLVDFNGNFAYDGPDGKYNGSLCASGFASCSAQKTLNVFSKATFIFSDKSPSRPLLSAPLTGSCSSSNTISAYIPDSIGNILPAGTAITFATTSGTGSVGSVTAGASYSVPSAAPATNSVILGQTLFDFTFQYGPATGCVAGTGTLNVIVTTPDHGGGGAKTTPYSFTYTITP